MSDTPTIDSHAHVWDRTCTYAPGARYHPDYEASVDSYLRLLDSHGVEQAVLVQPSFLGTDNGYLLHCLRAHPDRLRGIVVLPVTTGSMELDDLTALGVIGARYNLIGHDPEIITAPSETTLIEALVARDWWIEVQAQGGDWPMLSQVLDSLDARIMVDHFGKPSGPDCPGHAALLRLAPDRLTVKFSAPYRQAPPDITPFARRLIAHVGAARCLWGSDWPWTQNEGRHCYAETQAWLNRWTTPDERREMLCAAPALFGFAAHEAP